jgi:hypothetical protein
MTEKRIQYYDSMNGSGAACLDVLFKWEQIAKDQAGGWTWLADMFLVDAALDIYTTR